MNSFIEKNFDVTPKPVPDYSSNPICKAGGCNKHIPDLAVIHEDDFCSSTCARKFYGTELEQNPSYGPARKYNKFHKRVA